MRTNNALLKSLIALTLCGFSQLFANTMTYTFSSDAIAAAYSSSAYSGSSPDYLGTGWLGSYNTNAHVGSNNGRPESYTGLSAAWMNSPNNGAGIVDFFLRPDLSAVASGVTYSVIQQISGVSTTFYLGTSGTVTSSTSTMSAPNYTTNYYSTGARTMPTDPNRLWAEFGDVGTNSTVTAGTAANNRYVIPTSAIKTYLETGSNDVYDSATKSTRQYIESLGSTNFQIVLSSTSVLPTNMRFVFALWGDQYTYDSASSKWVDGTKNSALGLIALDVPGAVTTPEPGTTAMLGVGLLAGGWLARRRLRS